MAATPAAMVAESSIICSVSAASRRLNSATHAASVGTAERTRKGMVAS